MELRVSRSEALRRDLLYADEGAVRERRECDVDWVVGVNGAALQDDGHDACAGLLGLSGTWDKAGLHQAGAEAIDLVTGAAQAGDLQQRSADGKVCSGGEGDEIQALRGEVFAEMSGLKIQLFKEFLLEEVDLTEVGFGGVFADEVQVLDQGAAVGVTLNAFSSEKGEAGLRSFGKGVFGGEVDGSDLRWHGCWYCELWG